MTPDEVKLAVKEALQEERSEFWISQPQHYIDHKWVSSVRETFQYVKKAGLWTLVTTAVAFSIAVFVVGVKALR